MLFASAYDFLAKEAIRGMIRHMFVFNRVRQYFRAVIRVRRPKT